MCSSVFSVIILLLCTAVYLGQEMFFRWLVKKFPKLTQVFARAPTKEEGQFARPCAAKEKARREELALLVKEDRAFFNSESLAKIAPHTELLFFSGMICCAYVADKTWVCYGLLGIASLRILIWKLEKVEPTNLGFDLDSEPLHVFEAEDSSFCTVLIVREHYFVILHTLNFFIYLGLILTSFSSVGGLDFLASL